MVRNAREVGGVGNVRGAERLDHRLARALQHLVAISGRFGTVQLNQIDVAANGVSTTSATGWSLNTRLASRWGRPRESPARAQH